jgi:hypothetical protein
MPQWNAFFAQAEFDQGGPANYCDTNYTVANPSFSGIPSGQYNIPGTLYWYIDSAGRLLLFRYVQITASTFPTLTVGPVYWKTNTFQVVSPLSGDAISAPGSGNGLNSCAGILLNTSATDLSGVWIQVGGYLGADSDTGFGTGLPYDSIQSGTLANDQTVVPYAGTSLFAVVNAGTAPTYNTFIGTVLTTVTAGEYFDVLLKLVNIV